MLGKGWMRKGIGKGQRYCGRCSRFYVPKNGKKARACEMCIGREQARYLAVAERRINDLW